MSALQDLLYLLERGKATSSARDDKWANYCDTETLGLLGELLRLWCIGSLPNINQRKSRRKVLTFAADDEDGSDESDEFDSDEDDYAEAPNDEQLLSPLEKSNTKGHTLESLVVTIWKMLGETPKMQVKLASIAFPLFLIDVLPLAFQQHPKHAFFVMDLMRPYFTLDNAYTKQFIVLFSSLTSDTTQDFVAHYQERYSTLIAGPLSASEGSNGVGAEGSIDKFFPSGSVDDLLSLTSSGELDVNDLASSSEMTRYLLDTSVTSSSDIAPRRPRKQKPSEAEAKPVLTKKQSERLVRQETRRKLKVAESKANDESLRERSRLRLVITLWQNIKYFDPLHLPLLLRTKIADDLNTILTAQFLPDSIVGLAVDAVKYIGTSQAKTLETKKVLANMHAATAHVKDVNLKLSILDALSRFVSSGVESLSLSKTAVLNVYLAEFDRLAATNAPMAALLANRYIAYLNSAAPDLQLLAKEYAPSVSALFGLLSSASSLREAALLLLPKDPSAGFLLKTNLISVFKAYRKSSNQIPVITTLLLQFVRKILSTNFQLSVDKPSTSISAATSSSAASTAIDVAKAKYQESLPIASLQGLLQSDFFEQCFNEIEGTTSYDTNLHQMIIMMLEIQRPILDILVLRDGFFHRVHNSVFGSMHYYKPEYFKLHAEILPTWLKLLVKTHKLGFWVLDETTPVGATVDTKLHPIVIDSIVKHGGISTELEGRILPFSARMDRRIFEQLAACMMSLTSRRSQEWSTVQSEQPKIWKHFGYLYRILQDLFGEPSPKINEFLIAAAPTVKAYLIYHYLLDALTLSLERSVAENIHHFLSHLECISRLIIPQDGRGPLETAKASFKGKKPSKLFKEEQEDLPDPCPPPNSPMGHEYAELSDSIPKREAVMLSTDFEEAWQPKPKAQLPESVYAFNSSTPTSLEVPEAKPSRFARKVASKMRRLFDDDVYDKDDGDLFSGLSTGKALDLSNAPGQFAPQDVLEDATVPSQRIARLSRVVMKFIDSFDRMTYQSSQGVTATHFVHAINFLAVKDVWFRERLFAHPRIWKCFRDAKNTEKNSLMRLIVAYFRNETLQRTLSDPNNVSFFASLLEHVLSNSPIILPSSVAYHLISVWLSNEESRIAMRDHTKQLVRLTLSMKNLTAAQQESFVNLWIGVLEPLVKDATLYEGLELIKSILAKSSNARVEKLSFRLYLNKIEDALQKARQDDIRVDYDTGVCYTIPPTGIYSSALLRSWITLWRPGNDMRPIMGAFRPDLRAISNLVPLLDEPEFDAFLEETYSPNHGSVWNWIEFEKLALEDSRSGDNTLPLNAKRADEQPSIEIDLSLASSAPTGPSPRIKVVGASISSATSSMSQPTSTTKKAYSSTAKESAIREFVLCRFYQAELLATVLHARGRAFGEFYPLGEVKTATGTWIESDPLLRLLTSAFSRFEKVHAPDQENMSSCKRYASLIVADVVKNRSFFAREHPLVILAILQAGVLNDDLELEYELYSCLPEMYEAVEIERLRSVAILRDMTRCASRHPEEFCKRVPTLPTLIERALAYHDQFTTLETLALLNAISRQPMITANDVFRDLVLLSCYQLISLGTTQKKIKAHAVALVFSLRHFGSTPVLHEPIDSGYHKSSSISPTNKLSYKPSKPKKTGKYEKDDSRLPLLLLDHHKDYSGSISSHEDDYVELSLMEEEVSPRSGKRTGSNGSPATGSSVDSARLGLLESDDEWADVMKVVEKDEKAAKEADNGDVWRFQFLDVLAAHLTTFSSHTPLSHATICAWVDASPALTLALPYARIREQFDVFYRSSHGLLLRILESPDHCEAESMFWESVASGHSTDGELNNGPLIGGAFLVLALLKPELRRKVFFDSIEPESLLGSGSNLLSKIISSISRWQPYHRETGLVNLGAALLLLHYIATDLLSPSIMKSAMEQWNRHTSAHSHHPLFKLVSSKLDGSFNANRRVDPHDVKVKFFPDSVADCQSKSIYDDQLGLALQAPGNMIFAAPHKRPILALIEMPLDGKVLLDSGFSGYALNLRLNPTAQSNPSLRIGFATKSAMKELSKGAWLLGEVPGSYSFEQRSGVLLVGGATISTDRAPPSTRSEFEMEINFCKQTIAFTLVDSSVKHYYYVWNIDASETLYPVLSFESPAAVSLTERKTFSKASGSGLSSQASEATPTKLADMLRKVSPDAAHARYLASVADPLNPLDRQQTHQALLAHYLPNPSSSSHGSPIASSSAAPPPPPPPPPPAPMAPPRPIIAEWHDHDPLLGQQLPGLDDPVMQDIGDMMVNARNFDDLRAEIERNLDLLLDDNVPERLMIEPERNMLDFRRTPKNNFLGGLF